MFWIPLGAVVVGFMGAGGAEWRVGDSGCRCGLCAGIGPFRFAGEAVFLEERIPVEFPGGEGWRACVTGARSGGRVC